VFLAKIRLKFEAFDVIITLETPREMYQSFYVYACVCFGRTGCSGNSRLFDRLMYEVLLGFCLNSSLIIRTYTL
jgi:hypothetical protein